MIVVVALQLAPPLVDLKANSADSLALSIGTITVPFLHITAEHDHIVPTAASAPLIEMIGSADKEHVTLKGGHVSLIGGPNAVRRMWPKLDEWLAEKSL